MNKGRLIVISGFSGAGKGTVIRRLREKYDYSLSVSATTRAPREGEVDGRDYYFKTVDEFKSLIDYNGLIEWAQYVDNFYGTPRKFVEDELSEGRNVILEIEVQGAMKIREKRPDALFIFVAVPCAFTAPCATFRVPSFVACPASFAPLTVPIAREPAAVTSSPIES